MAPPCALLMLILAGYVMALREADVPESRRRIRTMGSVTMMLTQPLIVYLFAIATPADARTFMLTWALLLGLLGMLVVLAMLDVVNNVRISTNARHEFRQELKSLEEDVRRAMAERQAQAEADQSAKPKLRLTDGECSEPNE
ncbi:MAG: hypothetical protein H6808_09230 [Phycisphaera sp.]|nr:hypothetical protein [Phycisphaera sp.]